VPKHMNAIEIVLSKARGRALKLVAYSVLAIFLLLLPLFVKGPFYLHVMIMTLIYIIAVSSLRTISLSGQISIAHAAFMGIGGYTSAIIAKELGWTPWITMPLGALMAMVIAVVVGYPFSRLRALYFSMLSLFLGMGIVAVLGVLSKFTRGDAGLVGIPPLLGLSKIPYYYFFLILTIASLLVLYRLEHSRIGTTWKTIAQSYLVASSVGINEAGFRILALAVGCFFAGLAGAAYAHYNTVLTIGNFSFIPSINLLIYMLLGGVGSFAGPIVGTIILVIVPEFIRGMQSYVPVIMGAIMLLVVFLMPKGVAGLLEQLGLWIRNFLWRRVAKNGKRFT
jgi:branched-chain amino acid transport system permease protein